MLHELKASWCGFDLALGLRLAVLGSCGECDIVWGFGFACGASWIGMGLWRFTWSFYGIPRSWNDSN
jgi:hypothetical protein